MRLGNISILYRDCDTRLDIVSDFGYCNIVIWHKCCLFLVLEAALQQIAFVKYLIHTEVYKDRLYQNVVILYRLYLLNYQKTCYMVIYISLLRYKITYIGIEDFGNIAQL